MNVIVPAPKMGGWLEVNWRAVKKRVESSLRRSEAAREKAHRIERHLARSFTAKVFLWRQQDGLCPSCGQPITWATGWSIHHIFPRSQGGSDRLANLQLLHPACHRQLHAQAPAPCPAAALCR